MENETTFGHPGDPTQAPEKNEETIIGRGPGAVVMELFGIVGQLPDGRGLTVGENPRFRALIEELRATV